MLSEAVERERHALRSLPRLSPLSLLSCRPAARPPAESWLQHVLGVLRGGEQLGGVQRGRRGPQQRLLPGRAQRGAPRLRPLHHLPHPLHR